MSTYAGSSAAARQSWESKKPKATPVELLLGLAQKYAAPVALAGYLLKRYLAHKKAQKAKKPAAEASAASATPASTTARKPRRDYKVNREETGPLLVGPDDGEVEVQPHDNVVESYNESEVETAGAAAAGPGGGNNAMLQMLQQMGYRVVMPKDGSGQVFLVPPGAAGPGDEAIEEGDEEGYDEDEEGEEEDE